VHGDAKTSKVVGRRVEDIPLPKGATIAAIVRATTEAQPYRENELVIEKRYDVTIIAHHDTVIEPEDHVIVFVVSKKLVPRVEKLFQVGFGFL